MKFSTNTKIAITLSIKGVDTIAFLSADKKEAMDFYYLIQEELDSFQKVILTKVNQISLDGGDSH